MNVEALPILIKVCVISKISNKVNFQAITFCEIDVAKEFIFHEQIVCF